MDEKKIARFWSKVDRRSENECWIWRGYAQRYGRIGFRGRLQLAHRVAFQLARGEIPNDLHVLHRCDNTKCCNPSHLFLGTHQDNMSDKAAKGRCSHAPARAPNPPKGEASPRAKLTEEDVRAIRELRISGLTHRSISERFGVSRSAITLILAGKKWRHVA